MPDRQLAGTHCTAQRRPVPIGRDQGTPAVVLKPQSQNSCTDFEFEDWDAGRLRVNRRFAGILRSNRLTTCETLLDLTQGELVRQVGERQTSRVVLADENGQQAFYLKRHGAPTWRDRVRPLLNLSWPILGARNEWDAILKFHAAGIPTLIPVAIGEINGRSLLMTQDLETDFTLLDWVNQSADEAAPGRQQTGVAGSQWRRAVTGHVAAIARRMHERGIHHQDFYLNHLLWCGERSGLDIRVIDLGRATHARQLPWRWIIKDLAQLDYSARRLSCTERLRFLRIYLGRPFRARDRWLIRQIMLKSRLIAAHTAKHKL